MFQKLLCSSGRAAVMPARCSATLARCYHCLVAIPAVIEYTGVLGSNLSLQYTRAVRARHIASSSCESAVLVVILSIGDSDFTILGGAAGQMNKLEATAVPCETDTATPVLVELVSWRPNLSLLPPAPTAPPLPRAPAPQPPAPMTAACGAAWWQIGAPSGVSWLSRKNVLAAVAWRGKMPSACQLVDQLG